MAIPDPEPGLVINYAYLWHREHEKGSDEGRKDRPSVIVLAVEDAEGGESTVIVVPITHTPPLDPESAVEIPQPVKRRLGLDGERSWIVVSEGNRFIWPGYDLRRRADRTYTYGFLPPTFFDRVLESFVRYGKHRRARLVVRD